MEFYIDLNKGVLNTSKLVKRPVQVKGKNGKTFTRMQWVDPHDASTGYGVRRIDSEEAYHKAKEHGVINPFSEKHMSDQGIKNIRDHDFDKHPHFYMPETKMSIKKYERDLKEHKSNGITHEEAQKKLGTHIPHGEKDDNHKIHENEPVYEGEKPEYLEGIPEEFHQFAHTSVEKIQELIKRPINDRPRYKSNALQDTMKDHLDVISKYVTDTLADNKTGLPIDGYRDKMVLKLRTDAEGRYGKDAIMGLMMAHPELVKWSNDQIFGKKKADELRHRFRNGVLAINSPSTNLQGILKDGYHASTSDKYVDQCVEDGRISEEDRDAYNRIMEDYGHDHEEFMNELDDYINEVKPSRDSDIGSVWGAIKDRVGAEAIMGLEPEDEKPIYISYHPLGAEDKNGPCPDYGDAVVSVDPSVLKYSTAINDDSFFSGAATPVVKDMDHLREMYMFNIGSRHTHIPYEVQYHKSHLPKEMLTVIHEGDPSKDQKFTHGFDN